MSNREQINSPLLVSIPETGRLIGQGRSKVYELVGEGQTDVAVTKVPHLRDPVNKLPIVTLTPPPLDHGWDRGHDAPPFSAGSSHEVIP